MKFLGKWKFFMVFLLALMTVIGPLSVFASSSTVVATPVNKGIGITPFSVCTDTATLTIYADGSGSSSALDTSGHAFITLANISCSSQQFGNLTGIAAGNSVSIGTWDTSSSLSTEHKGLWYNLEAYQIYHNPTLAWPNRVSLSVDLSASQLSNINSLIANSDSWAAYNNNCSSFAVKIWNSVSSTQLSAGAVNTPSHLLNSIKAVAGYSTGRVVPYNYLVYIAHGTGAPTRSTMYPNF